jgi:mono/diheme cytochrome c family protein
MKKVLIIGSFIITCFTIISCGGGQGENPGRVYMPDMSYSRAYETYGYNNVTDDGIYTDLFQKGVNYNGLPVPGTMARGDVPMYPYPGNDSGYAMSVNFTNPLPVITPEQNKEAERLYLINCAICHGSKLDGNGPLWNGGDGPYPAAPRNLLDDYSKKLADGQYYHVITFGKGQMGSYASQVKPEQRWWIVNYIRGIQRGAVTVTDSTAVAGGAAANSGDTTNRAQ